MKTCPIGHKSTYAALLMECGILHIPKQSPMGELPYRADKPSPLGKVPQCAHWGGRGEKRMHFIEHSENPHHLTSPDLASARSPSPKGKAKFPDKRELAYNKSALLRATRTFFVIYSAMRRSWRKDSWHSGQIPRWWGAAWLPQSILHHGEPDHNHESPESEENPLRFSG